MVKVFIDGKEGTTGLRLYDRLKERRDVELLEIAESERKSESARKRLINESDVTFLCLPDAAAVEAVSFCENGDTVIIDASTAHRTADGWTYGFCELDKSQRGKIAAAKRIANCGCHAVGMISLARPLVAFGLLSCDSLLSFHSLTGYSGGGKKMIADYESRGSALFAPRQYGLTQNHKHLAETKKYSMLSDYPHFSPIVAAFYSGMEVTLPLFGASLQGEKTKKAVYEAYKAYYADEKLISVKYVEESFSDGFVPADALSGFDNMTIYVGGNDERITAISLFDNLGKGASGSALQCFNVAIGADELLGLSVKEQ